MAGSIFGKIFRISTFGESHGKGVGVVIDGCPAGLRLSEADIQPYMDRRRPGQSLLTTQRSEADEVEILSGVFEGYTTGTPIAILVRNTDQRSRDYSEIMDVYRPGHADLGFDMKYGFRDYRGGGRSSGRETLARVAAGAVAAKLLAELGITVHAACIEVAGVSGDKAAMEAAVLARKGETDSAGGIVECRVRGLKPGIGEPVFDKLDARLAQAIMSIGTVKGVEIGDGFAAARARGSENNDSFYTDALFFDGEHADAEKVGAKDGQGKAAAADAARAASEEGSGSCGSAEQAAVQAGCGAAEENACAEPKPPVFIGNTECLGKRTNHAGGILGGMSDGSELVLRAAFKPTASIALEQQTVNRRGENVTIRVKGRHDPAVVLRGAVVVECMTAITVLDALLEDMAARLCNVKRWYGSL